MTTTPFLPPVPAPDLGRYRDGYIFVGHSVRRSNGSIIHIKRAQIHTHTHTRFFKGNLTYLSSCRYRHNINMLFAFDVFAFERLTDNCRGKTHRH